MPLHLRTSKTKELLARNRSNVEKKAEKLIKALTDPLSMVAPKKSKTVTPKKSDPYNEVFGWAKELSNAKAAKINRDADIAVAEFKQQQVIIANRKKKLRENEDRKKKALLELTAVQERISQQVDQTGQLIKPPRHIEL